MGGAYIFNWFFFLLVLLLGEKMGVLLKVYYQRYSSEMIVLSLIFQVFIQQYGWIFNSYLIRFTHI